MNDTFTFLSLASVTGLVEGGSGDGADTLNFNFTTDQQLTQTLTGEGQGRVEGGIASLAYGGMDGQVTVPKRQRCSTMARWPPVTHQAPRPSLLAPTSMRWG